MLPLKVYPFTIIVIPLIMGQTNHSFFLSSQSGQFSHYERLDVGHVLEFAYHDMFLEHNFLYFVNLDLKNVLGYRQILSSRGILVDFTPPDTSKDELLCLLDVSAIIFLWEK